MKKKTKKGFGDKVSAIHEYWVGISKDGLISEGAKKDAKLCPLSRKYELCKLFTVKGGKFKHFAKGLLFWVTKVKIPSEI